jgi:hypothetical protein
MLKNTDNKQRNYDGDNIQYGAVIYMESVNRDDSFNKALITALMNIQNNILKWNSELRLIPVTISSSFKRSSLVRKKFS